MTIRRYKYSSTAKAFGLFASLLLWGCSAENFDTPEQNLVDEFKDAQIVLEVPIPRGEDLSVLNTRATQAAQGNELDVNDLRLYVFPTNSTSAAVKNVPLAPPKVDFGASHKYAVKDLDKNGTYVVYLLANFGTAGESFANSDALEKYVATYDPAATGGEQLKAGNLPMVFKSNAISLSSSELGPRELTAPLEYACVKVKYTIIFDKEDETTGKNFGNNCMVPSQITLTNVGNKVSTIANTATAYHEKSENTTRYESSKDHLSYGYFSNYSITANSATTGADKIKVSNAITNSSIATADKWVLQGVTYLPERHVSDAAKMTTLTMDSKVGGSDVQHTLTLGSATDKKNLKRGNYYEVIGRVKETGINGVEWNIEVMEWQEKTIDVDFVHTYLTLDKTEIFVDTENNGIITYDTDGRGGIKFECSDAAKADDGTPLFELAPATAADGEKKLVIRVNSRVQIAPGTEINNKSDKGDICYITAGNIKKAIYVKYNIKGFFEIDPTSMKIQKNENIESQIYTFKYRTNLGGIKLTSDDVTNWTMTHETSGSKTHKVGGCTITLKMQDASASEGTIEVTMKKDDFDATTVLHNFTAQATKGGDPVSLTVECIPVMGSYRIYFRAINDYQVNDNDEFGDVPVEYNGTGNSNANWTDYWDDNKNNKAPNVDKHCLYAYTQYGQAANKNPTWRYTDTYDNAHNNKMTSDSNNPGWYYYDIATSNKGEFALNGGEEPSDAIKEKYGNGPTPGATLLIFYSGGVDTRHRVNQEDEPGIQLGDDTDNETWVLFDPSRDPVYNVYNDKPRIEDREYIVYSDTQFSEWRNTYGPKKHNIHKSLTSETSTVAGYPYKYTIKLKAPRGEYDKNITLNASGATDLNVFRLYLCVPSGKDAWKNAELIIKGGYGDKTVSMTGDGNHDGMDWWYYDMNETEMNDAITYGVLFKSRTEGWTSNNNSAQKLLSGKINKIEADKDNWAPTAIGNYNPNATSGGSTTLFGGSNWTDTNIGYYKGGEWSKKANP